MSKLINAVLTDLRSDTMTKPTADMLKAMLQAKVGDDCYGEDETVTALEQHCANVFQKEAALFMPTGTMSNQVAMLTLVSAGDEIITETGYHIAYFESAQTSYLSHAVLNDLKTDDGILNIDNIKLTLQNKARWSKNYSQAKLVVIENSINCYGGKIFPLTSLKLLYQFCKENELMLYLDGARLLNACIASNTVPASYAKNVDALSICFAKGLGAPFGAMLMGSKDFISKAQKYRKWLGGGLHQAGVMAAACQYALENHMENLVLDHHKAKNLWKNLRHIKELKFMPVETNIVMFDVRNLNVTANQFVALAKAENLLLIAWSNYVVRAVTHRDVTKNAIQIASDQIINIVNKLLKKSMAVSSLT